MLFDGINLAEGSSIINATVASGSSFPSNPNSGELFFKSDEQVLYVYDSTQWTQVGSGAGGGGTFSVTGDVTGTLQNSAGVLTLETVNANNGSYSDSSQTVSLTIDEKGRITSFSLIPISIAPSQISSAVPVSKGGTGATTASAGLNALLPAQAGNAGKYLSTNGLGVISWGVPTGGTVTQVGLDGGATGLFSSPNNITTSGTFTLDGTLTVAHGGTGATTPSSAINNLLPSQQNQGGKFLTSDGTTPGWTALNATHVTTALGYTPIDSSGDTMTGELLLSGNPTQALGAATKQYVDDVASSLNIHRSCRAGTTAALTAIYDNGDSGVGATLTGVGALPQIGGVTLNATERVLVKNQNSAIENGIYVVSVTGPNWQLTRASDYDGSTPSEIEAGDTTFVQEGTLSGSQWVMYTAGTISVGSSNISWTQFGGPGSYSAGAGIDLANNVISNTGIIDLTAGTNIAITGTNDNKTISFTGVLPISSGGTGGSTGGAALASLAGGSTANRVLVGTGTAITLGQIDLSTSVVTGGNLPVTHGGTGANNAEEALAALLPDRTGNIGKFLAASSTGAEWIGLSVAGSGGQLQFNNSGTFDGTAEISYNATDTLTLGTGSGTFNIIGAEGTTNISIAGSLKRGGNYSVAAGDLLLAGGAGLVQYVYNELGQIINTIAAGPGGDVVLSAGTTMAAVQPGGSGNPDVSFAGSLVFKTSTTNSPTERLVIDPFGAWFINGTAGTSGQVLVSNGVNTTPTWQTPTNTGTVTSISGSGGTTGMTLNGGPITTTGTLTLGGTLGIANGGTGQTTASAALNALLPDQSSANGKVLFSTNGVPTWDILPGTGTVTSVDISGGATGLTTSGGPVESSGTITLGGTLAISHGGTGRTSFNAGYVTSSGAALSTVTTIPGTDITGNISGNAANVTGTVAIANGGTAATTAAGARSNLFTPSGNNGKYLKSNGTDVVWSALDTTTAAGSDTNVQFNDGGVTAGSATVTIVSDILTLSKDMVITNTNGNGNLNIGTGSYNLVDTNVPPQPFYSRGTAFGVDVLQSSLYGVDNAGFGYNALKMITNGSNNTAVGSQALSSAGTSSANTALGSKTLMNNTSGASNTAVGSQALTVNTTGASNTSVGVNSLASNTVGSNNTGVGIGSIGSNTTGGNNTALGYYSLANVDSAGNNTAVGYNALYSSTAASNTAVGYNALYAVTIGTNNVAVGTGAGSALTSGNNNTLLGGHAGEAGLADTVIISSGTTQRLRINSSGAYSFTSTNTYGTAGQVLMSNGSSSAPSWANVTNGTVTSVDVSGGTTGLTTSGGAVTSSGTITLGGTLVSTNGGTGLTSYSAGDMLYYSSGTALSKLGIGASSQFLMSNGTAPVWSSNLTIDSAGTLTLNGGTANGIVYLNGNKTMSTTSSFAFDGTSMGLGTGVATSKLDVYDGDNNGVQYRTGTRTIGIGSRSGKASIYSDAGGEISFNISGELMQLSSGGQLALGLGNATAWAGGYKAVEIGNGDTHGALAVGTTSATQNVNLFANSWHDGTNFKYRFTGAAGRYSIDDGAHVWWTAPSGTGGNTVTLTRRATLTSGGDLGLGVIPAAYSESARLVINASGKSNAIYTNFNGTGADQQFVMANGNGVVGYIGTDNNTLTIGTAATERLRITNAGAWGLAGANYGTAGQVLTSNGNSSAPTWQTLSSGGSWSGGTVTDAVTFLSSVAFGTRYDETRVDVSSATTTTIDCSTGNIFNVTLGASVTTLAFSNVPSAGRVYTLTLFLTQDATGGKTFAWPISVKWSGGTAPSITSTAAKTDIFTLVTHDGGTSWYGFTAGQNF